MASIRGLARLVTPNASFMHPMKRTLASVVPERRKINKVLIANRGEIACRIMRSCKKLGIKTVAVYSEADANALHVRTADEKYLIGPPPSLQSYLNLERYAEAIKATGADAVHPGYGFLSEKPKFAAMLESMGVAFIGPPSSAMEVMGDKHHSKQIGRKAGVSIIPGYDGLIESEEQAVKVANDITYPVMVKAAGGGGGKGMRIAWSEAEVREAYYLTKQEAKSAFNDDRLIVEKYIDNPRHIEIQLMADSYGNAVYLNERECSVQRRNQKVVEEAPSSFLDPETRHAMGMQAVSLAKTVGYRSAGTVEFLVDSQKKFYFLEMNTRLQVEHPVTEYITGFDLVEEMIKIAQGEPLSWKQSDVKINGWSFESRVYAEDPYQMLPSPGKITTYIEPFIPGKEVRCDSGVVEGSEIPVHYDPLICKLVTHAPTRQQALDDMVQALDSYVIRGVQHNIPLLRDILTNPLFQTGDISTKFMPKVYPQGFKGVKLSDDDFMAVIASAAAMDLSKEETNRMFDNQTQFAHGTNATDNRVITVNDVKYNVSFDHDPETFELVVNITNGKNKYSKRVSHQWSVGQPLFEGYIDGQHALIQHYGNEGNDSILEFRGAKVRLTVRTEKQEALNAYMPKAKVGQVKRNIAAPMSGKLVSINVKRGDHVKEGSTVAVPEAMKMQNALKATRAGIVKSVLHTPGAYLKDRDVIIEFYENDEDYKPLRLVGDAPAVKLFLDDLKISYEQVPSNGPARLEEGSFAVQQQPAILNYLARKFLNAQLTPEDAAVTEQLTYEAVTAKPDAAWLNQVENKLKQNKSTFLTGATFSPVDAAVFSSLKQNSVNVDAQQYPALAKFVAAVSSRA